MAETIITKRCSKCKRTKPISQYYKNRRTRDGRHGQCKTCKSQYQQQYRKTDKGKMAQNRYKQSKKGKAAHKRYNQTEKGVLNQRVRKGRYNLRHPERCKAKATIKLAVKCGSLPRPDSLQCHYCPKQAKDYHHHKGYEPEHVLDVIPVCKKCHRKIQL